MAPPAPKLDRPPSFSTAHLSSPSRSAQILVIASSPPMLFPPLWPLPNNLISLAPPETRVTKVVGALFNRPPSSHPSSSTFLLKFSHLRFEKSSIRFLFAFEILLRAVLHHQSVISPHHHRTILRQFEIEFTRRIRHLCEIEAGKIPTLPIAPDHRPPIDLPSTTQLLPIVVVKTACLRLSSLLYVVLNFLHPPCYPSTPLQRAITFLHCLAFVLWGLRWNLEV